MSQFETASKAPEIDRERPCMRLYCALAGGGAKGVGHVGALRALEENGFEFCGLSGTSAGAVVAALKAAGYTADEIIDVNADKSILDFTAYRTVKDFFPWAQWKFFLFFRQLLSNKFSIFLTSYFSILFLSVVIYFIGQSLYHGKPLLSVTFIFIVIASFCCPVYYICHKLGRGLLNLNRFRNEFGKLLDRRLFGSENPIPERVIFRHFLSDGRPKLKIVATNLSTGRLQLFSPESTPDVPVADAVAASICIPLLFRRWKFNTDQNDRGRFEYFLDGGLLSNLPAWVFDEERAVDREATTAAITTSSQNRFSEPGNTLGWVGRAIRTIIFGAAPLDERSIGRSFFVNLDIDLNMLDFDLGTEVYRNAVRQCYYKTCIEINRYMALEELPKYARKMTYELIDMFSEDAGLPDKFDGNIRAAVCNVGHSTIEIMHHCHYGSAPDKWLVLPQDIFQADDFSPGEGLFLDVSDGAINLLLKNRPYTWLRAVLQSGKSWILYLPITYVASTSAQERHLAILIDGDRPLPKFGPSVQSDFLLSLEHDLKDIFAQRFQE